MDDCDSKLQQARINLPSFALICKSFQNSDRAGTSVANAVRHGYDLDLQDHIFG